MKQTIYLDLHLKKFSGRQLRVKHIKIRHHFVKDHVRKEASTIDMGKICTVTAIFTKPLNEDGFSTITYSALRIIDRNAFLILLGFHEDII